MVSNLYQPNATARAESFWRTIQNPDGSLVFSAVLNDGQGLLSFLLTFHLPPNAVQPKTAKHVEGETYPAPSYEASLPREGALTQSNVRGPLAIVC